MKENRFFLDIEDVEPVSLFGRNSHAAAISDKGEVIFINHSSVLYSSNSYIEARSLPDGEKASSIVCLETSFIVLSSKSRDFWSSIFKGSSALLISVVSELEDEEIVCISGICSHCLAVSKKGLVF